MSNREVFGADIDDWVKKSETLMLRVFQHCAQEVLTEVQKPIAQGGSMPVVTGFLRSSLQVAINTPSSEFRQRNPEWDYTKNYDVNQYALVINQAKLGDTIYASFAANYAVFQEYGTSRMAGKFFVRNAAQKWPQIVAKTVRELSEV